MIRPVGRIRYFATTAGGLEEVLAQELSVLGAAEIRPVRGGVSFAGNFALGYRANLWLRTANRVMRHLADFPAPSADALYEGVRAIPWPTIFPPDRTFAVDAAGRAPAIRDTRFAERKAKDAVADAFRVAAGRRPSVDLRAPQVRIILRFWGDACTAAVDLSGETLSRRGYRAEASAAPLRETVAAGIVLLSGWDLRAPLCDPACGGGTIPIEAALIAANTAPGLSRSVFGFMHLCDFDPRLFARLRAEAREVRQFSGPPRIEGSDVSAAAIRAAVRAARRAKVESAVSFCLRDIRDFAPSGLAGVIICNPPYGVRMRGGQIAGFYRAFGETLKKRCRGWTAWILSGNAEATRHLGLKASRRIVVMNGPIECRLLRYDLY